MQKQLNQNLIDQWPEILGDVSLSAIPIYYLHSVVITFNDGNTWNVTLKKEHKESNGEKFTETLNELFQNYENQIQHVDFRLDIDQIKKDVTKTTNRFMKRKK
jgi:ABC-type transport system substrate-binding protein